MQHFIKYVLVAAVLLFGFHTASRYRASSPQQLAANVAESEAAALSSHPDALPTAQDSAWRAPVAALSDTERSAKDVVQEESRDTFTRPTLQRQPTVEKPSSVATLRVVEDWSNRELPWWGREPSGGKSEGGGKPNTSEKPNVGKKTPAADESRTGKKTQATDKRHTGGKADGDKRTKRTVDSAHGDKGAGSNSASSRQARPAPATPEWPIGEKLASSSKTTVKEQPQKGNQSPRQDKPETSSRRISPLERARAGKTEPPSRSNDDVDQPAPNKTKARRPEKPVQPAKDQPKPRIAEKPERHRIVDGDTLPKLAVAYLGDRERYLDIFQANRDVLSDPRLLPIGTEIAIPSGKKGKSDQSIRPSEDKSKETAWANDDGEMVPIPTFALPPRISR